MAAKPAPNRPMGEIVDRLAAMADEESVTLRDLIDTFGPRSFIPALMVPALLIVSPLSGIPVLPTILGLTIALIALQMAFLRRYLWLPRVLTSREISGPALGRAARWLSPVAGWLDRRTRDRLRWLTVLPGSTVPKVLCILCGLAMPFLELLPFSSSILGSAVLLFSMGLLARDGLYVIFGGALMGLAALVPITVWTWIAA
jgi:hypothetical protein